MYLGLEGIFAGDAAKFRKLKVIRDWVRKHEHLAPVRALIREHDLGTVCRAAHTLLEAGVFDSVAAPKFQSPIPDYYYEQNGSESPLSTSTDTSTESSPEAYTTMEPLLAINTTTGEVYTFGSRFANWNTVGLDLPPKPMAVSKKRKVDQDGNYHPVVIDRYVGEAGGVFPKPLTIYTPVLPLASQQKVVEIMQKVLENAFFSFAQKHMNAILWQQKWDCVEAGELNLWTRALLNHYYSLPKEVVAQFQHYEHFKNTIDSLALIRHSAVHRNPIEVTQLEEIFENGMKLLNSFDENVAAGKLRQLRRVIQSTIDHMKESKKNLKKQIDDMEKGVQKQINMLWENQDKMKKRLQHDDEQIRSYAEMALEGTLRNNGLGWESRLDALDELALQFNNANFSIGPVGVPSIAPFGGPGDIAAGAVQVGGNPADGNQVDDNHADANMANPN